MVAAEGVVLAERYRLERRIGEGGMGEVWAARHVITGKAVAVKLLKGMGPGTTGHRRFLQEARSAADIAHPAIVPVHDAFLERETPVLVMDLLEGETLGELLRRRGKLGVAEAAALLLPVMEAVAAAHARRIAHRDLKPENIFLAREGDRTSARVLDFGLAKLLGDRAPAAGQRTRIGAVLGTPGYMAPEQALGDPRADHRVDVWALGVILYRCLSGVRPVEGDDTAEMLTRLASEAITPLEVLEPELPAPLSALVGRMLSRDPDARPGDLSEVLAVLRAEAAAPASAPPPAFSVAQATQASSFESAPTVFEPPMAPGSPRAAWKRPAVLVALGVVLTLAGIVAVVLWRGRPVARAPIAAPTGMVDGRPVGLMPNMAGGVLLWLAPNGWQLRVGSRRARHFTGSLEVVRGEVALVQAAQLEADDSFERAGARVDVSFHTSRRDDFDGVSLAIHGDACVRVTLSADSKDVPADLVFVGRDGIHPEKLPFTACAGEDALRY